MAAEKATDARYQNREFERLRQIVIRSRGKSREAHLPLGPAR